MKLSEVVIGQTYRVEYKGKSELLKVIGCRVTRLVLCLAGKYLYSSCGSLIDEEDVQHSKVDSKYIGEPCWLIEAEDLIPITKRTGHARSKCLVCRRQKAFSNLRHDLKSFK